MPSTDSRVSHRRRRFRQLRTRFYFVYGIVTRCGGMIAVTSEPGRGSTFRVFLPRQPEAVQKAEPETPPPAPSTRVGETVLLVEDEPAVRRLARVVLERAGFTVVEATSPDEAEVIARALPRIDVLLTDVLMPGGTGPDLYRRLALRRPGLRVLFMSGYAHRELFDQNALAPDDAFVAKPFSTVALVARVREVLDQ